MLVAETSDLTKSTSSKTMLMAVKFWGL